MNTKRIIAIDYGTRNIGLAFTESDIPEPLTSLRVEDLQDSVLKILAEITPFNPDLILVGKPEGKLAPIIDKLILLLQEKTAVPIFSHPETLSTQDAITMLRATGANRKKLKQDHSFAACLILTDYLESLPRS